MSDNPDNGAKGAPGTPPALPSDADVARNDREARLEIGRRARRMAARCIEEGAPVSPKMLRTLGPAGQAYFFKVLREQLDSQFKAVEGATAKSKNQNAVATASRSESGEPLLISAKTWSDQRRDQRSSYGVRAVETGFYVALTLTLAAITFLHFHQDRELVTALIGFLQGVSHVLR